MIRQAEFHFPAAGLTLRLPRVPFSAMTSRFLALAAFLLPAAAFTAPMLSTGAQAAEIACEAARPFEGIRPPARYGNEEVAVAPWSGGMLFWSRDARYQFDQAAGVDLYYRNGEHCRVKLVDGTLNAAVLPVLPGQAERIEAKLCPIDVALGECQTNVLQFLPR